MFKLLTEEEKVRVTRHYTARRAVVILWALILVLVIGIVALLPAYLLSGVRQTEVAERVRVLGNPEDEVDSSETESWINVTNNKIKTLDPKLDNERPSTIIENVLDERYPGVRITNLDWSKVQNKVVLSVSGVANDRQTLTTFEDNLNASKLFAEVTLPISNLARDKNINFQLKLSPKAP